MENNSWIKLYRKAKDNDIMRDPTAWFLFSWILLSVQKDTGKWKVGRFMLADMLGIKSTTIYKTLKRLEKKYKVVTLSSNNRFTEITVLQWAKYQQQTPLVTQASNNKVTTKGQQSNNKVTLNKNKRIREVENIGNPPTPQKSLKVVERKLTLKTQLAYEIIAFMKSELGLPLLDGNQSENVFYAKKLLNKFGTVEKVKLLITALSKDTFWSTKITTLKRLDERSMEILKNTTNQKRSGVYVAK